MTDKQLCPCGSLIAFESCCYYFLQDSQQAQTAEQLMRSRYSAFATKNIEYLIRTHHPGHRSELERQELIEALERDQWLQLKILNIHNGTKKDNTGTVEFIAISTNLNEKDIKKRTLQQLHEVSHFIREKGRWLYLNGNIINADQHQILKWDRNNKCWCGSDKKYKKCHG